MRSGDRAPRRPTQRCITIHRAHVLRSGEPAATPMIREGFRPRIAPATGPGRPWRPRADVGGRAAGHWGASALRLARQGVHRGSRQVRRPRPGAFPGEPTRTTARRRAGRRVARGTRAADRDPRRRGLRAGVHVGVQRGGGLRPGGPGRVRLLHRPAAGRARAAGAGPGRPDLARAGGRGPRGDAGPRRATAAPLHARAPDARRLRLAPHHRAVGRPAGAVPRTAPRRPADGGQGSTVRIGRCDRRDRRRAAGRGLRDVAVRWHRLGDGDLPRRPQVRRGPGRPAQAQRVAGRGQGRDRPRPAAAAHRRAAGRRAGRPDRVVRQGLLRPRCPPTGTASPPPATTAGSGR